MRDSLKVGGSVPLRVETPKSSGNLRNLVVVDDVLGCEFLGHHTPAIALPKQLGYKLEIIDDRAERGNHAELLISKEQLSHPPKEISYPTLLQVFIRGNCFRGSAGLTAATQDLFKNLLKTGELQAIVIYGSPYILEQFLPELPPTIPYVFSYGQMPAAQAIALETLFGGG